MPKAVSRTLAVGLALLGLAAYGTAPAEAGVNNTYSFTQITNNTAPAIASQLQMTVYGQGESWTAFGGSTVTVGANEALFVFTNTGSIAGEITEIYFQDGTLLDLDHVYNRGTPTPTFSTSNPVNPSNLPGANLATPDFVATKDYKLDSATPGSAPNQGIVANTNTVGILFELKTPTSFAQVLAALDQGINRAAQTWDDTGKYLSGAPQGLRAGIHVTGIGGGNSNSFVTMSAVPEPGTYGMALSALGLLYGFRRWRGRRVTA